LDWLIVLVALAQRHGGSDFGFGDPEPEFKQEQY